MALRASDYTQRGFARAADGSLLVTTITTGAVFQRGFMHDTDGRLLVARG